MRLEFEPNVTALPLVENGVFEDTGFSASPDFQSLLKKGISAAQSGDREQARKLLSQATAIDPTIEDAWMWLASISDYPEELLAFLNRVLEINPENKKAVEWLAATRSLLAKTFVQRAIAAHREGHVDRAGQCLDQALHLDGNYEMGWFWKAALADDDDQKLEFLDRVLKINPENQDALAAVAAINRSKDPVVEIVDAVRDTVENPSPFDQKVSDDGDVYIVEFESDQSYEPQTEDRTQEQCPDFACPFCHSANDPQAFECTSCHATLTLSDIESLLSNTHADHEIIQHAVTQMEAEWNLREFDEQELTALGIGHFNLHNFESGFKYLQEASRLDPNNVILTDHVNTIAIRLEEMSRQAENNDARPVGKTILVVDDSPTVRKLISGKLEKAGHAVVCAVDGVDGLAKIEEHLPDLVLLDITMPRMDGYEVCKQIRANAAAKDLPVVMISGKDGFFDKVRGRMAGSTGYITKPFGPETLMKALETYLVNENGTGE